MTEGSTESEAPTELERNVIRQIEYYFGDMNLGRDKFLLEEIKKDDGWVSLETMVKFNRLKQLTVDFDVIISALKKSTAKLMEINEEEKKIRRSPSCPLPDLNHDRAVDVKKRSVYAKGFPIDVNLDRLMAFFEKSGKTEQIFMRRDKDRNFKGSCFVVYGTVESVKNFLESTEKFEDEHEVVRLLKSDYYKKKNEERKEEDRKKREAKEPSVDKPEKETNGTKEAEKEEEIELKPGTILELSNIPDDVSREDFQELFEIHAPIFWQEFSKGQSKGLICFQDENGASTAWEKAKEEGGGKVEIKGKELQSRVLEGSEEEESWKTIKQNYKEKMDKKRKFHHGHGGGGGKRKGKFGRKDKSRKRIKRDHDDKDESDGEEDGGGDNEEAPPPAKVEKKEENPKMEIGAGDAS